jgi:DNA polymerase III alpha subunit
MVLSFTITLLYTSFGQFVVKNKEILNKTLLEQYIKAGCFLSLGYNKESLLKAVESILEYQSILKDITTYTIYDFKEVKLEDTFESLVKYIPVEDKTDYEIQSLGLYLNKHPLEDYVLKDTVGILQAPSFGCQDDRVKCKVVGAISGIQIRKTKSKVNMANFNITSPEGSIKAVIFPRDYPKLMNYLEEGRVLSFAGMVKFDNDENMLMVNDISDKWEKHFTKIKKQIDFCSVYDIVDGQMDKIYIQINDKLKYVLEKKLDAGEAYMYDAMKSHSK